MPLPSPLPSNILRIQLFDWTSPSGRCSATFRVTSMLWDIEAGRLPYEDILAHVDREFVEQSLLPDREPNIPYAKSLAKVQYDVPVLGLRLPSTDVLLCYGTHRYLARYYAKEPYVTYRIIDYPYWLPYTTVTAGDITCL